MLRTTVVTVVAPAVADAGDVAEIVAEVVAGDVAEIVAEVVAGDVARDVGSDAGVDDDVVAVGVADRVVFISDSFAKVIT